VLPLVQREFPLTEVLKFQNVERKMFIKCEREQVTIVWPGSSFNYTVLFLAHQPDRLIQDDYFVVTSGLRIRAVCQEQ
jgi:hypothetical protein